MSKGRGKGDSYSPNSAAEDGLNMRESISHKDKLRGDTGEKTQRPTAKTETLKDDQGRGSFKSKC